jgi:hypothetical protein
MMKLCFNPFSPKKTKFNISLFLTFLACIFSESISLEYHYTFFLYKVIDVESVWSKKLIFVLLKIMFFVCLDRFDALISKIIF